MKQVRVVEDAYDDIEYNTTGVRLPADVTVTLSWAGQTVELDLTKENKDRLDNLFGPYLNMGRGPTDQPPRKVRQQINLVRNRLMRRFSDENIGDHPTWAYKKMNDGTYSYSRELREAYAQHEASLSGGSAGTRKTGKVP